MGVHYDRGFIGKVKEMNLRPATIDIGGGITFQGGVSQKRQMELMQLMGVLQEEYDSAVANHKATPSPAPTQPEVPPVPSQNGTPVPPISPRETTDAGARKPAEQPPAKSGRK